MDITIANSVTDLIQGDVQEHLPLERIPLSGDVLGLGTTTSVENGELSFLHRPGEANTTIWKCQAHDGSIRALHPGNGRFHFPYVCFTPDATHLQCPVPSEQLQNCAGQPLQSLIAAQIEQLRSDGILKPASLYGLRMHCRWQRLLITVASKLCMLQQRRQASAFTGEEQAGDQNVYKMLQHFRLAPEDDSDPSDPIRFLGRSLEWECCGFYDLEPTTGRVTIPNANDPLHLHGCSTDLRYGGHLLHEHPESALASIERLVLYPLQTVEHLASDLAVRELSFSEGVLSFTIANIGSLDVSDVGVAVVINDRFSDHRYLRMPWLEAGSSEQFRIPLDLDGTGHRITVVADPHQDIIEDAALLDNNRCTLTL
ncbi:MAG: CARDB domain-containing protein [Prochlorococcus sp.]